MSCGGRRHAGLSNASVDGRAPWKARSSRRAIRVLSPGRSEPRARSGAYVLSPGFTAYCGSGSARERVRPDTGGMPRGLSYSARAHAQGDSQPDRRAARHRAQTVAGDLSEDGDESPGRPDSPAAQPARAPGAELELWFAFVCAKAWRYFALHAINRLFWPLSLL